MLLLIYLRGLYCRFQGPVFFWKDKDVRQDIGLSQHTLINARRFLQDKELLKFKSGDGRHATQYTILDTVLLPELSHAKTATQGRTSSGAKGCKKCTPYNETQQIVKNKTESEPFHGMSEEDKAILRSKGVDLSDIGSCQPKGNKVSADKIGKVT